MPALSRTDLLVTAVLVVVAVALGVRHMERRAQADGPAAPSTLRPDRPTGSGGEEVQLRAPARRSAVVHVAGAVRRPGVYRLRDGARVRDAIRAAGGPGARAEVDAINLAAKVADGQQVVVPERASASGGVAPGDVGTDDVTAAGAATAPAAGAGPVNLNAATVEQLDGLDGIGPGLAGRILDWRKEHGGFRTIDDLAQVPGIGPKRLEALKGAVTV